MTARGNHRGHTMYFDEPTESWRYEDDGVLVSEDPARTCGHCKQDTPANGHDPCIANLPGVVNACCGHGDETEAYVMFTNGVTLRGFSL